MTVAADVLVDTSCWIDRFRHGNPRLAGLLSQDGVLMHPFVLLELACGATPALREPHRWQDWVAPAMRRHDGPAADANPRATPGLPAFPRGRGCYMA